MYCLHSLPTTNAKLETKFHTSAIPIHHTQQPQSTNRSISRDSRLQAASCTLSLQLLSHLSACHRLIDSRLVLSLVLSSQQRTAHDVVLLPCSPPRPATSVRSRSLAACVRWSTGQHPTARASRHHCRPGPHTQHHQHRREMERDRLGQTAAQHSTCHVCACERVCVRLLACVMLTTRLVLLLFVLSCGAFVCSESCGARPPSCLRRCCTTPSHPRTGQATSATPQRRKRSRRNRRRLKNTELSPAHHCNSPHMAAVACVTAIIYRSRGAR